MKSQDGQLPKTEVRPFFMVACSSSASSRLADLAVVSFLHYYWPWDPSNIYLEEKTFYPASKQFT